MFDYRHVDELVAVEERPQDLPGPQDLALEVGLNEVLILWQDDLDASVLERPPDARAAETAARIVAGNIGNDDLFGASLEAEPGHDGHEHGVGVGGLLGGPVPADIGFYGDDVSLGDEAADAS